MEFRCTDRMHKLDVHVFNGEDEHILIENFVHVLNTHMAHFVLTNAID